MEVDDDVSQTLLQRVTNRISASSQNCNNRNTQMDDQDAMSDDSVQLIPDTPSPVFHGKLQRKVAHDGPYALPKKLKLLVESESSNDELYPKLGRKLCKTVTESTGKEVPVYALKHNDVMDTDSDSAISTNNGIGLKADAHNTGSGDDGDLSSDSEMPTISRKSSKAKKSPAKIKKDTMVGLHLSDDSDFDIFPTNIGRSKKDAKGREKKSNKRRSLLPPIPGTASTDSASPHSASVDKDYASSVMTQLKRKGKFFPSLSSNPSASSIRDLLKATDSEFDRDIDVNLDCASDAFCMDSASNREGVTSAGGSASNGSPPENAENKYGGARPKTTFICSKSKLRDSNDGSDSDTDSLLSPPKRSKALHAAAEKRLAKRNHARASRDKSVSPAASSSSRGIVENEADPLPSTSIVNINWDSPANTYSPKRSNTHSPMNTDDSSDMEEAEWNKFILDMSKPYVELEKKQSPSTRRTRKARRRSSAVPSAAGSSLQVPNIVISPPPGSAAAASAATSFNLSPSISFTNSNQSISFTGKKSPRQKSRSLDHRTSSIDNKTYTVSRVSDKTNICDNSFQSDDVNSINRTDSPLANMITDMAIQDIDFDVDISPALPGFQTASSLLSSSSTAAAANPFSVITPPRQTRQRKSRQKKRSLCSAVGSSSIHEVIELDEDSPHTGGAFGHSSGGRTESDDVMIVGAVPGVRSAQIESDEAMARRLQEEMDREFAARLATNPPTPHQPTSRGPVFPGTARNHSQPPLHRLKQLPQYDFDVLCALVEGKDLPNAPPGHSGNLDEIVDPDLLAFIERTGVEYVRGERNQPTGRRTPVDNDRSRNDPDFSHLLQRDIAGIDMDELHDLVSGEQQYGARGSRASRRRNPRSGRLGVEEALAAVMAADSPVYQGLAGRRGRRGGRGMGRLMPPLAADMPAEDDYEALLALGERLGDVKPKGLSKDKISMLPLRTFKKESRRVSGGKAAECNVCCCEYDDGDELRILPCFHEYHSQCVDTWIKKNPTCPVCRADVWELYTSGSSNIQHPS